MAKLEPPKSESHIEVLLEGLTVGGEVYKAGQIVAPPFPARLAALAKGEPLLGNQVARLVDAPAEKVEG